jgi:tRNA 5-methylaminomethyl-2-thiouridine biosynthesis bifunctional protein
VLDTHFGSGASFLTVWQHWRTHPTRSAMLHYVGVLSASEAVALHAKLCDLTDPPVHATLGRTLAQPCYGLLPGFHRILLEDGQLSLTLCVGERSDVLAQQDTQVDCLLTTASQQPWDKWQLKALARCCKRGTTCYFTGQQLPTPALLIDAGFALQRAPGANASPQPDTLDTRYDPSWQLRSHRNTHTKPSAPTAPGRCAVIGAGIAGASIAQALAVRGWRVDVYDAQATCAGGASGLPVGLVVPHHSADDNARSRLSRSGTRLTLQHAGRLLQAGLDWNPSGILERKLEETDVADVEAEVLSRSTARQAPTGWCSLVRLGEAHGLWHPHAAWIKPARLVQQWLNHPGIHFYGECAVHTMQREAPLWLLRNPQGAELGRAELVVFANAYGSAEVLGRLAADATSDMVWLPGVRHSLQSMQAIHGTLSMGPCPTETAGSTPPFPTFPPFPVNGHGSLVANVPDAQGPQWFAGSTFQTDRSQHADLAGEHALNLRKLQALLPELAQTLRAQFDNGQVNAWQGTRCVTHDRLPLVGPLEDAASPTLWLCAGMGARGLSFSALCAELLVARLGGEPLPIESKLARLLATHRIQRSRVVAEDRPG